MMNNSALSTFGNPSKEKFNAKIFYKECSRELLGSESPPPNIYNAKPSDFDIQKQESRLPKTERNFINIYMN